MKRWWAAGIDNIRGVGGLMIFGMDRESTDCDMAIIFSGASRFLSLCYMLLAGVYRPQEGCEVSGNSGLRVNKMGRRSVCDAAASTLVRSGGDWADENYHAGREIVVDDTSWQPWPWTSRRIVARAPANTAR